jgi:NADP-dependent 3-hydroxy acid dehydrogenase YdfG
VDRIPSAVRARRDRLPRQPKKRRIEPGERMPGVEDRVALETGAGRGIGRATADLLASRGARVMAAARSENELQTLGVDHVVADLGTRDGCALAVEKTNEVLGAVEIMVCNHGIGSAHERVI